MTESAPCWPNSQEDGLRKDQGSLSSRPIGAVKRPWAWKLSVDPDTGLRAQGQQSEGVRIIALRHAKPSFLSTADRSAGV
jgi:hypothetical protein